VEGVGDEVAPRPGDVGTGRTATCDDCEEAVSQAPNRRSPELLMLRTRSGQVLGFVLRGNVAAFLVVSSHLLLCKWKGNMCACAVTEIVQAKLKDTKLTESCATGTKV
jgi:fumarylacetoacetate (FAA) hydrolase family protein